MANKKAIRKSVNKTFYLYEDVVEELKFIAGVKNVSAGGLLNEILELYIQHYKKNKKEE